MPVNRVPAFVPSLIELFDATRRSIVIAPLNLGGASGSAGGSGTPTGGVLGQLIQRNVSYDSTEAAALSGSSSLLDNLNHLRARSPARVLTNRSGGNLPAGAVVVLYTSADNSFETTNVEGDLDVLGVLQEATLSGSTGLVLFNGYSSVRVVGAVTRGDYLYSSTTPGYATSSASGSSPGCFGRALTSASGSLVSAVIYHPLQSAGGGGGGSGNVATDIIWDAKGDLAAGTGANAAARLPVGANGQVLVADSTQTTGLRWGTLSGSVAIDPLWDAKGDLAVGLADNLASRLPVGANGQMIVADSGQTLGMRWASGSAVPHGPAGGSLSGSYPNPTVAHSALTGVGANDHHNAVTLASDADVLLGLSTQQLTLDSQTANRLFAGPTSGGAADPTFRAIVQADLGTGSGGAGNKFLADDLTWKSASGSSSSGSLPAAVAARYVTDGTSNGPIGTLQTERIDFDDETFDTHNAVTTGVNWVFAAPETGYYNVAVSVQLVMPNTDGSFGDRCHLILVREGVAYCELHAAEIVYDEFCFLSGSTLVQLNAGDEFYVDLYNETSGDVEFNNDTSDRNHINIFKVPG